MKLAGLTVLTALRHLSRCASMDCKGLNMTLAMLWLSSMYHDSCKDGVLEKA